jgi:hypothetical protein
LRFHKKRKGFRIGHLSTCGRSVVIAGEWLAGASVLQPEPAWVAQLERSRDVIAQSLAVTCKRGTVVFARNGWRALSELCAVYSHSGWPVLSTVTEL